MSLDLDLQTAPELHGIIGTVGSWSDAAGGQPVPTMSGVYRGEYSRTLRFTVTVAGVIGASTTITVEWATIIPASGDGYAAGTLNLGTTHGYTAGDTREVLDGVSVAFAAGTFVLNSYFDVSLTPAHVLPSRARSIASEGTTRTQFTVSTFGRNYLDVRETSWDGRDWVGALALKRPVSILGDYLPTEAHDKMLLMEQERQEVTFGENYDLNTKVLCRMSRGTEWLPRIGRPATFARSGVATHIDHETGLIRHVATGIARYGAGLRGPGVHIDGGSQNELTACASTSGTLFWSTSGAGASAAWDTNVIGPMDPTDTTWTAGYLTGCMRGMFGPGTTTADHVHTTDTPAGTYTDLYVTASIWLKGRGTVNLRVADGNGSITHTGNTVDVALTNTWTRYSVTGQCTNPSTIADIRIFSKGTQAVFWAWGWQIEKKYAPTALIHTAGAAAARNAETLTFPTPIPTYEGTVSFWIKWGGDDGSSNSYSLIAGTGTAGNEQFAIWYNSSASALQFYTALAGADRFVQVTADLQTGSWYHIACTWANSAGLISRTIYVSSTTIGGTLTATDTSADWYASFGTGFAIAPSLSGQTHIASQYQELRVDDRAWSQAEVEQQYQRGTSEIWSNNLAALYGRNYRLDAVTEVWRGNFAPDHLLVTANLNESSRHDDSCIVESR